MSQTDRSATSTIGDLPFIAFSRNLNVGRLLPPCSKVKFGAFRLAGNSVLFTSGSICCTIRLGVPLHSLLRNLGRREEICDFRGSKFHSDDLSSSILARNAAR